MRKSIKMKVGAVGATFALAGGLAVVASGTTGAYFSDTKAGVIKGTVGNIHVTTTGGAVGVGDGLNFAFDELMPGVAQTATVNFTNSGAKAQDVYLTFPNGPALHALNNLGSYGEVKIMDGSGAVLFASRNLQDGRTRADLSNSCGATNPYSETGCWPLPKQLKVATNVAPQNGGSVSFSFNYDAKLSGTGGTGGVFNSYPSIGAGQEAFGDDLLSTGDGLPVNVVAVQVGKTPGQRP